MKSKKRLAIIIILAVVAALALGLGLGFGLRAKWVGELEGIRYPDENVGYKSTVNYTRRERYKSFGKWGDAYSLKYITEQSPKNDGVWMYSNSDGETSYFAYDYYFAGDLVYKMYEDSGETSLEYVYSSSEINKKPLYNYIKIIFDKSDGNIVRDCAAWLTKTVGGGRSTYRFSIPQNYLSENGIDYPGVGGDNKPMRNISFTIQVDDGTKLLTHAVCEIEYWVPADVWYDGTWVGDMFIPGSPHYEPAHYVKTNVEFNFEYGDVKVDYPAVLDRYIAEAEYRFFDGSTVCKGEYAEGSRPEGGEGVEYFRFPADGGQAPYASRLQVFADEDMLTAAYGDNLDVYRISTMEKLCSLSFNANVVTSYCADGKLLVRTNSLLFGGKTDDERKQIKEGYYMFDTSDFSLLYEFSHDSDFEFYNESYAADCYVFFDGDKILSITVGLASYYIDMVTGEVSEYRVYGISKIVRFDKSTHLVYTQDWGDDHWDTIDMRTGATGTAAECPVFVERLPVPDEYPDDEEFGGVNKVLWSGKNHALVLLVKYTKQKFGFAVLNKNTNSYVCIFQTFYGVWPHNYDSCMQLGGKLYVVCEGSVAVFDMAALGLE